MMDYFPICFTLKVFRDILYYPVIKEILTFVAIAPPRFCCSIFRGDWGVEKDRLIVFALSLTALSLLQFIASLIEVLSAGDDSEFDILG